MLAGGGLYGQSLYRVNCTISKYSAGEDAAGVNYCGVCLMPKHSGIQDGIGVSVIAKTQEDIGVSVNINYKGSDGPTESCPWTGAQRRGKCAINPGRVFFNKISPFFYTQG